MSAVALATRTEYREPTVEPGPPHPARPTLAVRVAWVAFGLQLVAMVLWSSLLYHRWGNTWDYALRYQAWWGIAHGHLDPYVSVAHRYYWQDHFELINWPLAPLSRIWPGGLWPLWIQDLMVVGGELGALYLVVDAVGRPRWPARLPAWVAVGLVTVLLVANPWVYESISFDFHYQSVGAACFAMLACREMIRGSKGWLTLWVVLCLACGDIAGTYLAAVGLGGVLAGREYRKRGAVLLVAGAAWFALVSELGGGQGSGLSGHYGYLLPASAVVAGARVGVAGLAKGMLTHPVAILQHLWQARTDLWAYSMSSGGLGLLTPFSVLPLLVLFEAGAGQGDSLRTIAYENFGAVLFVAPLTVLALGWLTRQLTGRRPAPHRHRRRTGRLDSPVLPVVVAGLLAVNAVAWGAVWIPRLPGQWLRVDAGAASTLDRVESIIPPNAEVVASQGVVGRFCGRAWCYQMWNNGVHAYPLRTDQDYFVIVPYQGIEVSTVQVQLSAIEQLAGPLHAKLLLARDGVWLFRLARPPGAHSVKLEPSPTEPAWAAQSATGTPFLVGPVSDWALRLRRSQPGYLLYGADWNLPPGTYQVTVTMATNVQTNVETWDTATDTLLSRRVVPSTNGQVAVQSMLQVNHVGGERAYSGWGPFSFEPGSPVTSADQIEVRVWTPGTGQATVYSVEIQPANS